MKSHPIDAFGIEEVSLSGIRVEKLETRVRPGVPFPHKHDFFQILLLEKGGGIHQIDFITHKVTPGQIFMMKPGQMHSWQLARGVRGILIEFSHQSLNSLKDSSTIMNDFHHSPDILKITKADFTEALSLAKLMLKESSLKREMNDLALQGQLTAFLIVLIRLYQKQLKHEKTLSIIDKFKTMVEKHFKDEHAVEFYAKKLGSSPKAFTMQLRRSLGKPPRTVIQERILLEAKRYLAFSDLSVAEIGYELGFDDANYFTRFFRIHEKKSPAKFRSDVHTS